MGLEDRQSLKILKFLERNGKFRKGKRKASMILAIML